MVLAEPCKRVRLGVPGEDLRSRKGLGVLMWHKYT